MPEEQAAPEEPAAAAEAEPAPAGEPQDTTAAGNKVISPQGAILRGYPAIFYDFWRHVINVGPNVIKCYIEQASLCTAEPVDGDLCRPFPFCPFQKRAPGVAALS